MKLSRLSLVILLFSCVALGAAADPSGGDGHDSGGHGAGHGSHSLNWFDFDAEDGSAPVISLVFNFLAMGFIVYLILRKGLSRKFKNRRQDFESAIESARETKAKAEEALAGARSRMGDIDAEMEGIRRDVIAAGEAQSKRIVENAERRAERMLADTKMMLEQEIAAMVQSIREELTEQIVQAAEGTLVEKIQADDQTRLTQDYLKAIDIKATTVPPGRPKVQ